MYLAKSIIEGLKILGFDKETIKQTSREKTIEEIFLSTLFLNYLIVLVIYLIGLAIGGYSLNGNEINTTVLLGFLLVYPFAFNLVVYGLYGFFGLMAEMINRKNHIKPLIAVGFHSAIVYTLIIYVIALISMNNLPYAIFLFFAFGLYFVYTIFVIIHTIYDYSLGQTFTVVILPILLISILLLVLFLSEIPSIFLTRLLG